MIGYSDFILILFKHFVLPKIRYMDDDIHKIYLNAMPEIYMMAMLNFKVVRVKCPPPI